MYRIVESLSEYKVAFRGLSDGKHSWHFNLDDAFFDNFEALNGTRGTVDADVTIRKSSSLMEISVRFEGIVTTSCDRCLGELRLPVRGESVIYAGESERMTADDGDFIILSPEEDYIDLAELVYQTYLLNYPIRAVHPEGECDTEMEEILGRYVIDEDNKPTDPRWDELKKLIN